MARKPAVLVSLIADWDGADLQRAQKELTELQKKANATAEKMQAVGKKLSMAVTAPLVGVGIAAGKLAMDFDDSMSKIVGLVGIGADEVNAMKESVLGLAGETAQAPVQLADAMFVVQSAGLRGADAMEALEFAAKAGSAGLGDTADVARSVAGALNAYGSDVLSAAEATDIIVATARAGNFETSQFAGALGDVLPFAQAAQASFEDVGGAVALLTRTNGNASKSITQVTALFRAFAAPSKQTQTLLAEVGLSAQDMRDAMAEKGLTGALRTLDDALGGNREQLGLVLGSSEATAAALQVLNADANALEGTFGTVADSAGLTDEAFDAASETAGFKFRQAIQSLQATLITFGDQLAPVISGVSGGITAIANAFGALPAPMKTVTVVFAGLAAAIGPVLFIGGKLLTMFAAFGVAATKFKTRMVTAFTTVRASAQTMSLDMRAAMIKAQTQMGALGAAGRVMAGRLVLAFRTIGAAAKGLLASFGPIGAAITLLSVGFTVMQGRMQETKRFVDDLRDSIDQTTGALTEMSAAMVSKNFRLNLDQGDIDNLREMGVGVNDLTEAVLDGPDAVRELDRRLKDLGVGLNILGGRGRSLSKARDLLNRFGEAAINAGDDVRVARDDAFAAARGFDASGSSAMESVYGYDAATGGLKLLQDSYEDAGAAAADMAVNAATAAEAAAAAADAARAGAYNAVTDRKAYFDLAAAYNKNAREARQAADDIDGSFGNNGVVDDAMTAFEERVKEASDIAIRVMDDVVKSYYDSWQDAYKEAVQFGNDLASGITGQLNFGSAVDEAAEGGGSIVDAINSQASKVGDFNQQLIDLLGTNLSEEAFQAVAAMGAERGAQLADELLGANGAEMIAGLNKVVADAEYVADQMGKLAAEKWRGAGVRSAQATYEGIRDNFKRGKGPAWRAVMNTMDRLAADSARQAKLEVLITRKVNEQVDRVVTEIKVPAPVAAAQIEGQGATGAIVRRPTVALIGEAGPEALLPLDRTRGNSPISDLTGGGNITINVNAGIGTDGAEVGRQVVDAIKAYERRNGRVYAAA